MNVGTLVLLLALVAGAAIAHRRRATMWTLGLGLAALLPGLAIVSGLVAAVSWPVLVGVGAVVLLVLVHRWRQSSTLLARWAARSRRKSGVASGVDVLRARARVRRKAPVARPSLAGLPRWRRLVLPTTRVGVRLCRSGLLWVWESVEGVILIVGGPRTGKTGALVEHILTAPGALVVTSTRPDTYQLTRTLRARTGPVLVFNAAGLGGIESTVFFDPLHGCADPVTATERALDMIPYGAGGTGGSADRETWNEQARRVLAGMLYAAALGGHTMRDVQSWVSDPSGAGQVIPQLLRRAGDGAFEQDVLQFLSTNDRTRSSITSSIVLAFGWMTRSSAVAAARPGCGLDVEWFLNSRATIYLLGAEEARIAPLVCALTGHIAREARRIAAEKPGGRLDPPLRLALDEAALICPVPLHRWTADMGGRGVSISIVVQSRAQLLEKFGDHATATILNNTSSAMVFGGMKDRDDLAFWSALAGDRDETTTTTDRNGRVQSRSVRRVPVIPPAQIAGLPDERVLLIRRGMAPVIGQARMGWKRRDVKVLSRHDARMGRAAQRSARLDPVRQAWARAAERVLALAAGRSERFHEAARRRRDLNAMFEQLERIQRQPMHPSEPPAGLGPRPRTGDGWARPGAPYPPHGALPLPAASDVPEPRPSNDATPTEPDDESLNEYGPEGRPDGDPGQRPGWWS